MPGRWAPSRRTPDEHIVSQNAAQSFNAALTAGWLNPMRWPARVAWRSVIRASNTSSRFKSMEANFML